MEKLIHSVLLSASPLDNNLSERLKKGLTSQGLIVNVEQNTLIPNDNFPLKLLNQRLGENDIVIILVTQNSYGSQWLNREISIIQEYIYTNKKTFIPIVYGESAIPDSIKQILYIKWNGDDLDVINKILRVIRERPLRKVTSKSSKSKLEPSKIGSKTSVKGEIRNRDTSSAKVITPNYWLFKMNPIAWNLELLKVGDITFFHTHYIDQKRPEYDLLKTLKNGDKVLVYATHSYQSIVCIMNVLSPAKENGAYGERIEMIIESFIKPEIPFGKIQIWLDPIVVQKLARTTIPPELFFPLTPDQYQYILIAGNSRKSDSNEVVEKVFQPFYVTEGNHKETEDRLDFENDIDSFASVIALEKVHPPLAIGLFGNWGSGKSFFMEKLEERIEMYAKSNDEKYVKDVIQVKFNSWHYSDANLWASLITEIFDSLKIYAKKQNKGSEISKLQRTLKTTILEREAIEKKRVELEKSVRQLESEQAQKRERLEDISGIKLVRQILLDKRIKKDFSELIDDNIEKVIEDNSNIDKYIKEIKSAKNQTIYFVKELINFRGWRWVIVIAFAAIVALGVPIVKLIFPSVLESITLQVRTYSALVAAFLANIVTTIKPFSKSIKDAVKRLQSLKDTMESRVDVINPHLDSQKLELDELQRSLTNLDAKIADAKDTISDILSGRQLLKFIDEKTKDENYRNSLGIISSVRKDFITLDKLLREQHSLSEDEKTELFNPENVQLRIDRIVLYIDDLDRCNEDVVVKVLEAIHLILAFPLFVVIVGVDPRWLNNALTEKYKNLFGENNEHNIEIDKKGVTFDLISRNNSVVNGAATSYDYLEKIFQIPFALKPIDKKGRESLIQYLMKDEMEEINAGLANGKMVSTMDKTLNQEPKATIFGSEDDSNETHSTTSNDTEGVESSDNDEEIAVSSKNTKERLLFSNEELAYIQKISLIFGKTPRTINRYVNIYRIIKAHGNLNVVGNYSKAEFVPIIFLLGIIVGFPAFAEDFMSQLSTAKDDDTFHDFINKSLLPEDFKKIVNPFISDFVYLEMSDFKRNKDLISRFSFRTLVK